MMKLVVGLEELESLGNIRSGDASQEFRDKMLTEFLENQFPSWSVEMAFGERDWDFLNDEVHIEMPIV